MAPRPLLAGVMAVSVPRSPPTGALCGIVRTHLIDFLTAVDARTDGVGLPSFVVAEFRKFLRCEALAHGFARVRCKDCASERLVPFSLLGDEDVRQHEATGGKVGHDWNGTHCLILHTTARKSGHIRRFPLISGRDGGDYVIVASKGGAPEHPGWYQNLVAHADVKILSPR